MTECLRFHIELAGAVTAPTEFRLVNGKYPTDLSLSLPSSSSSNSCSSRISTPYFYFAAWSPSFSSSSFFTTDDSWCCNSNDDFNIYDIVVLVAITTMCWIENIHNDNNDNYNINNNNDDDNNNDDNYNNNDNNNDNNDNYNDHHVRRWGTGHCGHICGVGSHQCPSSPEPARCTLSRLFFSLLSNLLVFIPSYSPFLSPYIPTSFPSFL